MRLLSDYDFGCLLLILFAFICGFISTALTEFISTGCSMLTPQEKVGLGLKIKIWKEPVSS